MRTLHVGLRVSDLKRSLAFYTAVSYTVVGTVEGTGFGSLTMLRLPGDSFVTIELVYDPAKGASTSAPASTTSSSRSSRWMSCWPISPPRGLQLSRPHCPPAPTGRGPRGSPTRRATGSSWSSSRPAMLTALPKPTSLERSRALQAAARNLRSDLNNPALVISPKAPVSARRQSLRSAEQNKLVLGRKRRHIDFPGSQTGSHRWQTPNDTRRHAQTIHAARYLIERRQATSRNLSTLPSNLDLSPARHGGLSGSAGVDFRVQAMAGCPAVAGRSSAAPLGGPARRARHRALR